MRRKFQIGDRVEVTAGYHDGRRGEVCSTGGTRGYLVRVDGARSAVPFRRRWLKAVSPLSTSP